MIEPSPIASQGRSKPEVPSATQPRETFYGIAAFRVVAAYGVIFLHTDMAWGYTPSLAWFHALRNVSIPFFTIAAFFLLAGTPRTTEPLTAFVVRKARRLTLPLYFWTAAYWLSFDVLRPLSNGQALRWPDWSLVAWGYFHLWFLQFLFVGSIVAFLLVRQGMRRWLPLFIVATHAATLLSSFWIYVSCAILGIALGQKTNGILTLIRRRPRAVVAAAAVAAAVHVAFRDPSSRLLYSLATFGVTVLPFGPFGAGWVLPLSRCSYGIYVIHLFPLAVLQLLCSLASYRPSAIAIVGMSLAIFAGSYGLVTLAKRTAIGRWVLP